MQQHESEDLRNWLSAALDGSPQALGELLEALRNPLREIADLKLGPSLKINKSTSDLVQESLVAAAASFSQFRGRNLREFRAWVAQILEHRAIEMARKSQDPSDVSHANNNGHVLVDEGEDPEFPFQEQAVYTETLKRLLQVLEGLSEEDRSLIHWRYQDGQSFEEIGKKLGWPCETTRRRWYELVERVGLQIEGLQHGRTDPPSR